MATMVLSTGCSNDEVVENFSPENAIEFGTYVGRDAEARVAETTTETLQASKAGFGVFANYTEGTSTAVLPNFMNNQQVTYDATEAEWTYNPVKYWPNSANAQVSFWAYAPYAEIENPRDLSTPTFAISDGTDYVAVAEPVVSGKQGVEDKVKFTFAHMMSKIGFKVEAVIDEMESNHTEDADGKEDETTDATTEAIANKTQIVVTKVKMSGVLAQAGTMTWQKNDEDDTYDWSLTTTENTESKDYELISTNFANRGSYTSKWDYQSSSIAESVAGQLVTIEKVQLNNENSYFMVIPQTVDITMQVEYHVITEDGNLAGGYSNVKNTVTTEPFNFTFERGKAYNFVLHLGLTSVKFDAQVSDWEDATEYIVNVPVNVETTSESEEGEE